MIDALINSLSYDDILILQKQGVINFLKENLRSEICDYSDQQIKNICQFFANIVDYKSSVTKNHSLGVASKCYKMAKYYKKIGKEFPYTYSSTNFKRGVYFGYCIDSSLENQINIWRNRWLIGRMERMKNYD
jgi:HD-GYP domain-containing protein (c-di-GMP phosphodiesterase class II)